jgi:hypothetical protein
MMKLRRVRREWTNFVPLVVVMMVMRMIVAVVLVEPVHGLDLLMVWCISRQLAPIPLILPLS